MVIEPELPAAHQAKAGTPTGGGILFVALALVAGLLATAAGHPGSGAALAGLLLGGLLGLADDLRKLRVGSLGIPARLKFPIQLLLAIPVAAVAQEAGQRNATPAETDDQRCFHSRAAAADASAATAPTVQKTASMRFSDHPSSWNVKWIGVILKIRRPPVALK